MPVSKAQIAATNKFNKANYDNLSIRIPKNSKTTLKELADQFGLSLAGLIMWSISKAYEEHLLKDTPLPLREKVDGVIMAACKQFQKEDKVIKQEYEVVKSEKLSSYYDERFIVVDKASGIILDDAQGYGYKSVKKAYAAYAYKNRDKSKDKENAAKIKKIKTWMNEHKDFVKDMDTLAFDIAKGSWGPEDKFDAKFVKKMLKDSELEVDFTAGDLFKVWSNR